MQNILCYENREQEKGYGDESHHEKNYDRETTIGWNAKTRPCDGETKHEVDFQKERLALIDFRKYRWWTLIF